jgi:hypothetical protein
MYQEMIESGSIVSRPVQVPVRKWKNTLLDYYKTILEKVSFDSQLFSKEYNKAINALSHEERAALNNWIKARQFDA